MSLILLEYEFQKVYVDTCIYIKTILKALVFFNKIIYTPQVLLSQYLYFQNSVGHAQGRIMLDVKMNFPCWKIS